MAELWIIEDRESDRELAVYLLKRTGLSNEVRCFSNADSALEALESGSAPLVIILDLKLPGMSGLDFLRAIRQKAQTRNIPVIVFTASDEQNAIMDSYELGANAYLQKPLELATLLTAFATLGLKWTMVSEETGKES